VASRGERQLLQIRPFGQRHCRADLVVATGSGTDRWTVQVIRYHHQLPQGHRRAVETRQRRQERGMNHQPLHGRLHELVLQEGATQFGIDEHGHCSQPPQAHPDTHEIE